MTQVIIGHEFQRSSLRNLHERGKLPSTMMFAGIPGIGKRLVASELARTLLCERAEKQYGGCGNCHACHVFDARNNPDFYYVQAGDRELWGVEQIRDLLFSLHLSPLSSKARIVLFDDAEQFSLAISNTLLKILEEPPNRCYFILIATNPSKLPPTLLSRCQIWFFDALRHEQVHAVLRARNISDDNAAELAAIADGSLDGIDHIAQHIDLWRALTEKLDRIASGSRSTAALLASDLGRDKEMLPAAIKLMRIHARGRMIHTSREGAAHRDLSARWGLFVTNLLSAEHFLFERNLAPTPLLSVILDALASLHPGESFTCFTNSATVLSDIAI